MVESGTQFMKHPVSLLFVKIISSKFSGIVLSFHFFVNISILTFDALRFFCQILVLLMS